MKWETWKKREPRINVAVFDSTQTYDGPGQLLTDADGNHWINPEDERKPIGPIKDGDRIYINRYGKVFHEDAPGKLDEEWEREASQPETQPSDPGTSSPGRTE